MKNYSTKFIKEYIEEHKTEIDYVECGMREDWSWTAKTVYKSGEFCKGFNWNGSKLKVAGISGSTWATPIMVVHQKDGNEVIIDCWTDDGDDASPADIAASKAFALATGGMDYRK